MNTINNTITNAINAVVAMLNSAVGYVKSLTKPFSKFNFTFKRTRRIAIR